MDTTSGGDLFGQVWAYIIKAFGGGACVDTDTGSSPKISVTDTGSSPKSLFFYYIWIFISFTKELI
jgi:hypothetical protein